MCRKATVTVSLETRTWLLALLFISSTSSVWAQSHQPWRAVGPGIIEKGLAGPAAGPVDRVWYSANGEILNARTGSRRVYSTSDLDRWSSSAAIPPDVFASPAMGNPPEQELQYRIAPSDSAVVYAFGQFVYRTLDGGKHWDNLTSFRGFSLVGDGLHDLAISPVNPEDVVVSGDDGLFRSADGGLSWSSLNGLFPNLNAQRLLSLPEGPKGMRIAVSPRQAVTLPPGEKRAWMLAANDDLRAELDARIALERAFGVSVTAVATAGDFLYAGTDTPEIRTSPDRGLTWQISSTPGEGAVERFWVDATDPRIAFAVLRNDGDRLVTNSTRILRTSNGGGTWDDMTGNLPEAAVHAIALDRTTGSLYAATDMGVYTALISLNGLGAISNWNSVPGLPPAPVNDVKLDAQSNQLWAALDGPGVYVTLAPHRVRDPRVVSAADLVGRAVAPGALLTILGQSADSVGVGDAVIPVLALSDAETQIQIPFDLSARIVSLQAQTKESIWPLPAVPVIPAVPTIFVDRDGSPMIMDAETGAMLDADHPAQRGAKIQILAAGLGRVAPEWPAGVPAPAMNSPKVNGTVHAYIDRTPVKVTQAVLAPGYIGMYLVEISVPASLNSGPAELFIDVDGAPSNRVRVYIEP